MQEEQQLYSLKELQKKVVDKHSPGVMGHARQNVLSLVVTQVMTAIFAILWMLRKKGVDAIEAEIVLLPLIVDALQSVALSKI
jgi:hypothetical protein